MIRPFEVLIVYTSLESRSNVKTPYSLCYVQTEKRPHSTIPIAIQFLTEAGAREKLLILLGELHINKITMKIKHCPSLRHTLFGNKGIGRFGPGSTVKDSDCLFSRRGVARWLHPCTSIRGCIFRVGGRCNCKIGTSASTRQGVPNSQHISVSSRQLIQWCVLALAFLSLCR